MNYIAITTYAKLKSGGTTFAMFETNKTELDDELIQSFYEKFPDIEKIYNIGINSKEEKDGFPVYSKHYNLGKI